MPSQKGYFVRRPLWSKLGPARSSYVTRNMLSELANAKRGIFPKMERGISGVNAFVYRFSTDPWLSEQIWPQMCCIDGYLPIRLE